jgi:putative two-component system response regulator
MTRVLVIDDERIVRELMMEILAEGGYEPVGVEAADQALEALSDERVAIVVSDIVMPGLNGLELLNEVHRRRPSLPVVMVTGSGTHANLSEALARGANGLVMKPFSHAELVDAVSGALARARRSERELRERLLAPTLASALANAIEARDPGLHGHCERLARLAVRLASDLGLESATLETVRLGAILHDVGKIGIPDRILLKERGLTADEIALMRSHPLIGDRLLEPLDLLQSIRPVVRYHHERWDGQGYPDGLAGEQIPLPARIVAVADAIEAMSARRVYRQPLATDRIARQLERGRGAQWDPRVVDAALALIASRELAFGPDGLVLRGEESTDERPAPRFAVLLVEDDPDHADLARRCLERAFPGVAVAHAGDAASATELCRSSVWSLILLDHHLPDGFGLDLLGRIRESAPHVPVVMLTAEGSETVVVEAFRRGASDYVVKRNGFTRELAERVRTLLEAA